MENKNFGVIMAGGIGTRFWPMSTSKTPKQFLDILGTGKSFLQSTFERLNKILPSNQIYVVTTKEYKELTKTQLPQISDKQIIQEPSGRNTAPCNLYAALKIAQINPKANLLVAPSDHLILNEDVFAQKAKLALQKAAQEDCLLTLGIQPTRPDTGYGYIQFLKQGNKPCKPVKTFMEKPSQEIAQQFIDSGDFLWNAGIFVWSCQSILQAFEQYLPEMFANLASIKQDLNTAQERIKVERVYPTLQKISIDNGILEKANNVLVIPSSFGWSDLGTWDSLYENGKKNEDGNHLQGKHICTYHSNNSLLVNKQKHKAMIVSGLEDYIVVDTENALLICPKTQAQEVKRFVNDLRINNLDEFV